MTKTLTNLENHNFGVVTQNRYILHFDPEGAGYTVNGLPGLYRQIEDRFSSLPGIANVSVATYSPLEGDNWSECIVLQGHPVAQRGEDCDSTWDKVDTHFLDAIGVPIVRGRGLTGQDTATSPLVAVVNEAFVKKFFPNQDPIGRRFGLSRPEYSGNFQIVGVFRDFMMNLQYSRTDAHPLFLRPITQQNTAYKDSGLIQGEMQSMYANAMIIDFRNAPPDVESLVRKTFAGINPNLTVRDLRTFGNQLAGNFNTQRLVARLTGLYGLLAVALASIGLYGVMSYFVARRTSEIGIRMALGATRQSVVNMVMRGALWQILIGLVLGIPASLYVGYLMKALLYGVDSYNFTALVGAPLILLVFATAAAFLPALRAASIEPMRALRME
jgi:macrolide transport system ATP-binding/permease protein